MGRLLTFLALAMLSTLARAEPDLDLTLDVRAVSSDGLPSYLNGGLGKLRFDPDHEGLRLGQLRLGLRTPVTESIHFTAEATAWGDHDRQALDLIEAVFDWRPLPSSLWRSQVRVGAFYAPISLENRMRGWRTPYTISPSAINTWVGEELRTIGAEYNLDWLGAMEGHGFEAGFTAAAYGWNDPAGIVLALRGWSIHDRQTTLFGLVGRKDQGMVDGRTLFYDDIDHNVGVYAGGTLKWRGLLELRALRYDNRGNPEKEAYSIDDYAWDTRFDSFGARLTPDAHWTLVWQYMRGITEAGEVLNKWYFGSQFVLASWQTGPHRLSARAERFGTRQVASSRGSANNDHGNAWTAAYGYQISAHWSVIAEGLWIRSRLPLRRALREPVFASERQLQLSVRLDL
jgi:hypothetical protein